MISTAVFGAGQGGKTMRRLMSAQYRVIAYCDNREERWGTEFDGLPVYSPSRLLEEPLQCIVIAIMNREACDSVEAQLRAMGFAGKILSVNDIRGVLDARLAVIRLLAQEMLQREIPGDIAELGVYRGDTAAELSRLFPNRTLHLFDTFEGFDDRDLAAEQTPYYAREGRFSDTSPEFVRSRLPHPDKARLYPGYFPQTAPAEDLQFALVSIDPDLYLPTKNGLAWFWPRLSPGGCIVIHDYNSTQFPGVKAAVEEFTTAHGLYVLPLCDLHGSCILQKQGL